MIIGVISDTHIPVVTDTIPNEVTDKFKGVDLIIHAGDLVSYSIIQDLEQIAPVEAVSGNMDGYDIRQKLPGKKIINANNFKIGISHGSGPKESVYKKALDDFSDDKVDCIIFGHSHYPYNKYHDGVLLFNPGSATDRRFSPECSIGFLKINDKITGEIVYL